MGGGRGGGNKGRNRPSRSCPPNSAPPPRSSAPPSCSAGHRPRPPGPTRQPCHSRPLPVLSSRLTPHGSPPPLPPLLFLRHRRRLLRSRGSLHSRQGSHSAAVAVKRLGCYPGDTPGRMEKLRHPGKFDEVPKVSNLEYVL
ncbi:actin nucleation-promoting factor WAS-like [Pongo pygmaeus]|uniref:actin nucleation-promoting factor WAS-like n=1 Tax=Pongo pygmaeus TaxID=9600 RepID=UPI0023E2D9AD|nr:actin nucleation-promoting factor WAS-like [Pongo pygmaeus]